MVYKRLINRHPDVIAEFHRTMRRNGMHMIDMKREVRRIAEVKKAAKEILAELPPNRRCPTDSFALADAERICREMGEKFIHHAREIAETKDADCVPEILAMAAGCEACVLCIRFLRGLEK